MSLPVGRFCIVISGSCARITCGLWRTGGEIILILGMLPRSRWRLVCTLLLGRGPRESLRVRRLASWAESKFSVDVLQYG